MVIPGHICANKRKTFAHIGPLTRVYKRLGVQRPRQAWTAMSTAGFKPTNHNFHTSFLPGMRAHLKYLVKWVMCGKKTELILTKCSFLDLDRKAPQSGL